MQAYPLEFLLGIRTLREEDAAKLVKRSKDALAQAQATAERMHREAEEFAAWRTAEEERRWKALIGAVVPLSKISEFHVGLAHLAAEQLMHEKKAQDADRATEQARAAVRSAQKKALEARKDTAKIESHKSIWVQEAKLEAERAEDRELEEFHPAIHEGAESDEE